MELFLYVGLNYFTSHNHLIIGRYTRKKSVVGGIGKFFCGIPNLPPILIYSDHLHVISRTSPGRPTGTSLNSRLELHLSFFMVSLSGTPGVSVVL